jgi:CheY-like chemotaxis protein
MARILVIDDEHNVRAMIRLTLQHCGYEVVTASDGPDGLARFGEGSNWDLLLLDQRMPYLEGLEVLRTIRQRDPYARVIMITAFGTIDLAVEAMKAGATEFLRKPFTADVLHVAVDAALSAQGAGVFDGAGVVTYGWTTLNGFKIETTPGPGERNAGDIRHAVTVVSPTGERRTCSVLLPVYIVELIKAITDRERMPGGERFWQALCEETMANFLWQHADFPPDASLEVDDLTIGLRRWIDTVLTANEAVGR